MATLKKGVTVGILILAVGFAWCAGPSMYMEMKLNSLPGVTDARVVDVGDFRRFLAAIVSTRDGQLAFWGIESSWLVNSDRIDVTHVGDRALVCYDADWGFVQAANLADGEGSAARGLGIRSVRDAVAAYEALEELVGSWPTSEEATAREPGSCYTYESNPRL